MQAGGTYRVDETYTVGERVRDVRKRRGLSQRQLADLSGVSVSLIRKLEHRFS
jgi:transcriptional regulator with XRE-family HTH domain